MGCNCGDNEYNITVGNNGNCEPTTPIYNITLANVGVNGYSPIVRFINETVSGFNIAVDNITGTETSPEVPKLSYLNSQITNVNNTIANLGNTYLTRNGSNASTVVTFNGITMQSNVLYGNNSLSLRNKAELDSYINLTETGVGVYADTFKYNGESVLTTSSIANKLNTDGSNAANPIVLNHLTMGYQYGSPYINSDSNLYIRGAVISLQATSNINLSTTGTNKAYYNNKEIATVDNIPDITTKLNTDGSNADADFTVNGTKLASNGVYRTTGGYYINTYGFKLDSGYYRLTLPSFNLSSDGTNPITLNTTQDLRINASNENKVYYHGTSSSSEIATKGDIGNGTITITQGGVSKGTFTTNQSGNTTIDLDSGAANPLVITDTNGSTTYSLSMGINTSTHKAEMSYGTSTGGSYFGMPIRLIGSTSNPLKLTDLGTGINTLTLNIDSNTLEVNQDGELTVIGGGGSSYTAGTGIDITNDTISIDTSVVAQLSDIPDTSDMATQTWVGNQGYITGINSSDVTTALGYTPYNGVTNPNGYITNSALNGYATETWVGQRGYLTNSITENITIQTGYGLLNSINKNIIKANGNAIVVGNDTNTLGLYGSTTRPSYNGNNLALYSDIPTVNNSTITFTQGGVTKGTITLNQSSDATIALDAGGSGSGGTEIYKDSQASDYLPSVIVGDGLALDYSEVYTDWTNPQMSSASQDGYVVTSNYNSSESGAANWKAFDKDTTTSENAWWTGSYPTLPAWIQLEVPTAVIPTKCTIYNEVATPENFRNGVLQGSNDGITYDDLYTITDRPNTTGYSQAYDITTSTAYKYLRLSCTSYWHGGVSIQEIIWEGKIPSGLSSIPSLKVDINDTTPSTTSVYSSQETQDLIDTLEDIATNPVYNYTVIGNPTITNNIVSGITADDYIDTTVKYNNINQSWELKCKVYVTPFTDDNNRYFGTQTKTDMVTRHNSCCAGLTPSGQYSLWLSSNGSSWDIANKTTSSTGAFTFSQDTYIKVGYTGTYYYVESSTDDTTYTRQITVNSSTPIYNTDAYMSIGAAGGYSPYLTTGTIYMDDCSFTQNGVEIWNGQATGREFKGYTKSEADNKFLTTDLSNLSATGQAVIDGQWVSLSQGIITSATSLNGSTNLTYTVEVPDDGHVYEILLKGEVKTGTTSGNFGTLSVKSNELTSDWAYVAGALTRTSNFGTGYGTIIIPIKRANDNLTVRRSTNVNCEVTTLQMLAYRRVGTNS